jgi:hypothetical protein
MTHKKTAKTPGTRLLSSVQKEMARPQMARSARIAELKLDTGRIAEEPSTTMQGTVEKIVPASGSKQPEKAQVTVDVPDRKYRNLRIENSLTDEHGDDVKLKKGAHVEVTVTEDPKTQPPQTRSPKT